MPKQVIPHGYACPLFVLQDAENNLHILARVSHKEELVDITQELANQLHRIATRAVKLEVTWENSNAST